MSQPPFNPYPPPGGNPGQPPRQAGWSMPPPPPPPAFGGGHPAGPPRVAPPAPQADPFGAPRAAARPPAVAWLIPLASLLAIIGVVLPWFTAQVSGQGRTINSQSSLHAWNDGKIGLVPAVVLLILGVGVVGLLTGRNVRRYSGTADPVSSVGKFALGAGVATLVCVVIAWFFVPSQYTFGADGDWDSFEKRVNAAGYELSRGPQTGYFLTIAAGVVALVAGALVLATATRSTPATGGPVGGPGGRQGRHAAPENGFRPMPEDGFGPMQAGFGPSAQDGFGPLPQGGFGPPAQSGFGPPTQSGYGPPGQSGFGPPAQPDDAGPGAWRPSPPSMQKPPRS